MKLALIACGIIVVPSIGAAEEPIEFNRDVRPIRSNHCYQCHGPNEHDRQADLRLDKASGPDGAYRKIYGTQAIKPSVVAESEVWHRVNSRDDDRMPPPDSSKKPLNAAEKEIIKRWIEEGAAYAQFWAFVTPQTPALPNVGNSR